MRKAHIRKWVMSLLMLAMIGTASAQDGEYYTVRDFEVWSAAKLKYKMNKDWSMGLEQQFRFKDNASTIDQYFTEFELKKGFGQHFSAAYGARFIRNNDTEGGKQGYENFFRWNADLGFKHDINRLTLKYRIRYQAKNELSIEDEKDRTIRFMAEVKYNIKNWKLDPQFSSEIFNNFSNDEGFNKLRFTLETDYKIKNIGELGVFYRMEHELIGLYPKTTHIAGFTYQYTLKSKNRSTRND